MGITTKKALEAAARAEGRAAVVRVGVMLQDAIGRLVQIEGDRIAAYPGDTPVEGGK